MTGTAQLRPDRGVGGVLVCECGFGTKPRGSVVVHLSLCPLLLVFSTPPPSSGVSQCHFPAHGQSRTPSVQLRLKHICMGHPYFLPVSVAWLDVNKQGHWASAFQKHPEWQGRTALNRAGLAMQAMGKNSSGKHCSGQEHPTNLYSPRLSWLLRTLSSKKMEMTRDGGSTSVLFCFSFLV